PASVQLPTAASPLPLVAVEPPVTLPPAEGVKVTAVPVVTTLPCWSVMCTAGLIGTAVPAVVVWLSPAVLLSMAGRSGSAVAVKVTGPPTDPVAVTVLLLVPATVPSVQLVRVAMPEALVATLTVVPEVVPLLTDPPPAVTVKVTLSPGTG